MAVKSTSYEYGKKNKESQLYKYRNRENNHWKNRIELVHFLFDKYALPRIKDKKKEDIVIVDVGTSIGTFALEFAKRGYNSYGIDMDESGIEIAEMLCKENNVNFQYIIGDISEWQNDLPQIDVVMAIDIFEHLHDDELGAMIRGIKKNLKEDGLIIYHTYPNQYDLIFFTRLNNLLRPFKWLSVKNFEKVVKILDKLIDIFFIIKENKTYWETQKREGHCNLLTKERLEDIFERAGMRIILNDSSQIYPMMEKVQKRYAKHPISHRNIYGIVGLKK